MESEVKWVILSLLLFCQTDLFSQSVAGVPKNPDLRNISQDSVILYKRIRFNQYATFYSNGRLKSKGKIVYGKRENGVWRYYYESGEIQATGKFKNGKKLGKWRYYDRAGKLIKED